MSNTIPKIAVPVPEPAHQKPPVTDSLGVPQKTVTASTESSPPALSTSDIAFVMSLMGAIPAQKMEDILLKTGIPIPVNLGPMVDTKA